MKLKGLPAHKKRENADPQNESYLPPLSPSCSFLCMKVGIVFISPFLVVDFSML